MAGSLMWSDSFPSLHRVDQLAPTHDEDSQSNTSLCSSSEPDAQQIASLDDWISELRFQLDANMDESFVQCINEVAHESPAALYWTINDYADVPLLPYPHHSSVRTLEQQSLASSLASYLAS